MNDCALSDADIIEKTQHWLTQAVIGLNLCPFAKAVYVKNQIRYVVSRAAHLDAFLETLDAEIELLAKADPEIIDTTLLIHPTLFASFEIFNDMLELAEAAPADLQLDGVIQVASFHPQFQFTDTADDDISNYTNRAPFPTLHLIRESSMARAVQSYPDAAVIYERNIQTLQTLGLEGWKKLGLEA